MKMKLKKAELAVVFFALASIGLIALQLDSGMFLTVGLSSLAMFYLYFSVGLFNNASFQEVFQNRTVKKMSIAKLPGIAIAIICLGTLFKFQSWPGHENQLLAGTVAAFLFAVIGLVKYDKERADFYKSMLTRLVIFAVFGLLIILTPKEAILELKHKGNPEYVEAVKNYWANPEDMELKQKMYEEQKKLKNK